MNAWNVCILLPNDDFEQEEQFKCKFSVGKNTKRLPWILLPWDHRLTTHLATSNEAIKNEDEKTDKYFQAITIRGMLTFQIVALQILMYLFQFSYRPLFQTFIAIISDLFFSSFEQWDFSIVAKLQMIGIFCLFLDYVRV